MRCHRDESSIVQIQTYCIGYSLLTVLVHNILSLGQYIHLFGYLVHPDIKILLIANNNSPLAKPRLLTFCEAYRFLHTDIIYEVMSKKQKKKVQQGITFHSFFRRTDWITIGVLRE